MRHAERDGFEVHALSSPGRLTAGFRHKAAKGELRQGLPVGLDYDEVDRVVITPDEAMREAIATVFRRFEELGSARQVLIRLREDGVLLPPAPSPAGREHLAPHVQQEARCVAEMGTEERRGRPAWFAPDAFE